MELGKATLHRSGMNSLQNALHPDHGLMWTDGKGIYLAPVHLYREQVENAGSTHLGEFEYVQSVHWSCCLEDGSCYMAAVHQHTVTVWRVSGAVPRLAFKQVRKINVQAVPQGCLWNPKTDVLCLLGRQQCSFYFRHAHNRGSFAFPSLEHEKISCGCWSPDGKRLVVCVGAALLIYTWTDLEANISDFTTAAWRVPGVPGIITAIVPAFSSSVICASDVPLETRCTNSNTDAFIVPDGGKQGSNDIRRLRDGMSARDSLFNLHSHQKVQESAKLSVIHLKPGPQDPMLLTSVCIPGVLSPDLLHFQGDSQSVVVGSNTQCTLQVFALLDNHLLSAGHVTVEKEERPKGVCSLHTTQQSGMDGVLVLVGTTTPTDAAFPSVNNTGSFVLSLKFFHTRPPEKKCQLPNGHAVATRSLSSTSLTKSESLREHRSKPVPESYRHVRQASYKGERPDHRFRSPDRGLSSESRIKMSLAGIHSGEAHASLVEEITDSPRSLVEEVDGGGEKSLPEELKTEKADFSESSPRFNNSEALHQYGIDCKASDNRTVRPDALKPDFVPSPLSVSTPRKVESSPGASCPKKSKQPVRTEGSVRQNSVTTQNGGVAPKETASPRLSGVTSDRDSKQGGDDEVSVCSSLASVHSNYEVLEKQIQAQNDQIAALQKKLEDLSALVETAASVFPNKYQDMTEPEVLSIQCVVGGARVTRKFLLDSGRLQLDSVKQAFGLLTVELILDGEALVLGANIDGYIPMKFTAGSFLRVTGIPVVYSPQFTQKVCNKETTAES